MPNPGNTINVSVTANTNTNPGTLTVVGNNGDHIDVSQQVLEQTIHWNLHLADGQSGSFNPLDQSDNSGLSWTSEPPPQTIIHSYEEPSGTRIQVVDTNTSASDHGGWSYKLRATINEIPCETNPPSSKRTLTDPYINNR